MLVYGDVFFVCLFFFKQKTAYEMRISDWSSDVCSSDLEDHARRNVEIDIVGKEVFGGPREREDVPEAEAEPAHMAEDELRLRRSEREVEEFLIVAGDDAGIIHDDDHPLVTRMFDERQHARLCGVEFLPMRMNLEQADAARGHAIDLGERGKIGRANV